MSPAAYSSAGPTETLRALPTLAPGVTIPLLRRCWDATPADKRTRRATMLTSSVAVGGRSVVLSELTLDQVEQVIGSVSPRFVVKFFEPSASRKGSGVQVRTFVNRKDADDFASGKRLYAGPAQVKSLEVRS